jgi:hypothetical protein
VLYVDNLSVECTTGSLSSFVGNLGVRVISCFKVVPRHRRGQPPDSNRAAFRLCVASDDIDKVLDPAMWPDCVTISEWTYMEPAVQASHKEKRGRFHSPSNPPAAGQSSDHEETESMDATVVYNGVSIDTETSAKSAPPASGISISTQQEGSVAADGSVITDEYRRPNSGVV